VTCDVLETSSSAIPFASNESVLVWVEAAQGSERGIVLGRITESDTGARSVETPDELVIEARRSLTLRVGSGSITIREDGKILIKGKDLVSHATRLNRIKGGAVQIN